MSFEPESEPFGPVIPLEGTDGRSYNCQILHTFRFEDSNYALLLNLGETNFDPEQQGASSIVVMRMSQRDNQTIFQVIESEDEFQRVIDHVEEMVKRAEEEGDEGGAG